MTFGKMLSLAFEMAHLQFAMCYHLDMRKEPIETRFWRRVQKSDGCWIWMGGKSRQGYGSINERLNGVRVHHLTHRWAWQSVNGPIPDGGPVWRRRQPDEQRHRRHRFAGDDRLVG